MNALCFRQYALAYLQEPDDVDLEYKKLVPEGKCCNGKACNPDLGKVPALPKKETSLEKPGTTTFAGTALDHIIEYCKFKAGEMVELAKL